MKYTNAQIESVLVKLKEMPEIENKSLSFSKQEAVRMLKKEIASMQQRGYTLDKISEILRGEGIDINTPTLKSYLQRAKSEASKEITRKADLKSSEDTVKTDQIADISLSKKIFTTEI